MQQYWKAFLRWVRSAARWAWPKIQNAAELAIKRYGDDIFDLGLEAVNIAQAGGGTHGERLTQAKKHLQRELRDMGKEIFDDSINFVIESQVPNKRRENT